MSAEPINTLLEAAWRYAHAGLAVFPVGPLVGQRKRPLTEHGHKDATTDIAQIEAWWRRWPNALIGHRIAPDVILLDVDPRHNGKATWDALRAEMDTPATRAHMSGRGDGGGHTWWQRPEGKLSVRLLDLWAKEHGVGEKQGPRWISGIDLLTHEHRYTILPPSPHPDTGEPYRWAAGRDLSVDPAPLPPLLVDLLVEAPEPAGGAENAIPGPQGFREVDSPADWYSQRTQWTDLLPEHGWSVVAGDGNTDGSQWRHPAATTDHSATITNGCLFVYSTSTGFEPTNPGEPHGYTPFAAYAVLAHDGDQTAAAGAVRRMMNELEPAKEVHEGPPGEHKRFMVGGSLLDQPEEVPAIWGHGTEVLWAEGEPLLLVAPPGVGKTTLAGQILGGLVGTRSDVLGWPIATRRHVLYLAGDRPSQILRSLRRQFGPDDRGRLDEHLTIWRGPPPQDLAQQPETLVQLCREAGADTVVLDSLKDMAVGLSEDAIGAGLNRAIQLAIVEGVEVLSLHHQRKGQQGVKPKTLEDVYGSTWITAGAGSVVLLWGSAGDLVVELVHLKQPVDDVGPLQIEHDHSTGTSSIYRGFDFGWWLRSVGEGTAADAAKLWLEKTKPTTNEVAKARRKLDKLANRGLAITSTQGQTKLYRWSGEPREAPRAGVSGETPREPYAHRAQDQGSAGQTPRALPRAPRADATARTPPSLRGVQRAVEVGSEEFDPELHGPDGEPWCRPDGRGGCLNGSRCQNHSQAPEITEDDL